MVASGKHFTVLQLFVETRRRFVEQWTPTLTFLLSAVWKDIGVEFYRLLAQEFGTDHAYNCDMFNEMQPLSDSLYYLRGSSQAVIDTMLQADDKAVWIMQGKRNNRCCFQIV